jgi:hypothetical protein
MEIRDLDEWGSVEYVLSKKEWDKIQTRIEKLETENAKYSVMLDDISYSFSIAPVHLKGTDDE